ARVVAGVGEGGGDRPVVDLVVLIVGVAAAETDALHARERIAQLAAHVDASAHQVDGRHVFVLMLVVMVMVVVMIVLVMVMAAAVQAGAVRMAVLVLMTVARQSIFAALLGEGRAQVAARADP
ncbi:hypothetical protein LTR94_033931, partial [Friedmanniomyces endolithicus]